MAKQYGSYLGGFSGKLGPAIGYMWNGRWCMRSRPAQVHNPRTEAQVAHRTAFKGEVQLAARMRWAVMQGLTASARELGMTAYNLFVSLNQPVFSLEAGQLAVDWSRLQLSVGPVAPVKVESARVKDEMNLEVDFERNPLHMSCDAYDEVHLFVYSPAAGQGYLAAPVYRRQRKVSVMLPDSFAGSEVHIFMYVTDQQGRCSETAYGGMVSVGSNSLCSNQEGDNSMAWDEGDKGYQLDGGGLLSSNTEREGADLPEQNMASTRRSYTPKEPQ